MSDARDASLGFHIVWQQRLDHGVVVNKLFYVALIGYSCMYLFYCVMFLFRCYIQLKYKFPVCLFRSSLPCQAPDAP